MTALEQIQESESEDGYLLADGFDKAVIGTAEGRVIYSVTKCLDILESQGMNYYEAREYFDFNVAGAYVGEQTPIWCEMENDDD